MNIIEENNNVKNNNKVTRVLVILMIITVLISIGIIGAIYYLKATEFKFLLNGETVKNYEKDLFVFNNDKVYVSIKDMALLTDYKAYNGAYGSEEQYSEDNTKCYVEGKNEVASFEINSNIIYKIATEAKSDYEYFEIDEPVVQINNKLYTTPNGISKALNLTFYFDKSNNQVTIYTLQYLVNYYTANNQNAEISNFNNQKALLYNLLVVSDETAGSSSGTTSTSARYGVYTLDGKEVVGTKYQNIEFIESTQEFLVTTTNKKVGILSSTGSTKIQPQYDELKQIDKDLNLYLATNNKKQGIIQENGKILIYLEYDKIGLDTEKYKVSDIKNPYIIYNNCIPVCQNGKWGMYNKTGKIIVPVEYDDLGCQMNSNNSLNANSILIIPEIKGIVVCKKYETMTLYGVLNYQGKTIIPTYMSAIYSITNSGKQEYYMVNVEKTFNVIEWVNKNVKIDELNVE